jgi:aryl-alcohol dehydrogenase-like predicted oxidoreductase
MHYQTIAGVNKPLSRMVQGTTMVRSDAAEAHFALLDAALAAGCNTFDVAHVYGNGDVERTFGRWLQSRGVREQVVIIGKGAHHNQDRQRVTPYDITSDLHDSLARMQIEHIDLYLLHRDDERVPVGPLVEVLNEHQRAGLIGAFGGSNWSHERIAAANAYAVEHGLMPFVASSPNFSLAEQQEPPWRGCISISGRAGEAARAWYAAQHMPLFTWSSLAGGFFSGRFRRDNLDSFTTYNDTLCVRCYATEENFARLERAEALAERKGFSLPQIALAYVLNQPLNTFALVAGHTVEEVAANVAASELALTSDEIAWLEQG